MMLMDDYFRNTTQKHHHHNHSDYDLDDDIIVVENDYDYHNHNYHDITNEDDDDVKIVEPDLPQPQKLQKKVIITENHNEIIEKIENSMQELNVDSEMKVEGSNADMEQENSKIDRPSNLDLSQPKYQINKMHMGLKNISHNVGAAVTPSNKMEFYQEKPESFGQVKITQPIGVSVQEQNHNNNIVSPASSLDSDKSHLTDQGFFDLKFYHNKLW